MNPDDGWLHGSKYVSSPNSDARPAGVAIDLLVIHGISLPPGQYGGAYIEQLFTNRLDPTEHPYFADIAKQRVSAHVLIRRDGEVIQFVAFTERAWHAGESCFGDRPQCNDYSIGVELEGSDDEPYAPVQYDKLAEVTRLVMQAWPAITSQRIVGHSDIAPGRKTDPGERFDWQGFRRLIAA